MGVPPITNGKYSPWQFLCQCLSLSFAVARNWLYKFCFWVDPLHPAIRKMFIELLLNRIRRSRSGLAGRVAGQCQGGERHICDHQNNCDPRQHRTDFLWYLFDPAGEQRVNSLQPYNRCDPPKKAVEQVDSSAKVERDVTVVPEGRAK